MRIISGKFKGRRISAPAKFTARPTTDFAKEGLFNVLNNLIDFEDLLVLDLFAGTGSIGLEFISRDCRSVVSVEKDEKHCRYIRSVCEDLKVDNLLINRSDVFRFLQNCHMTFDLIFADPPYDLNELATLPDNVFSKDILSPEGLFILEHGSRQSFETHPNFSFHRSYGNVNFSFFTNNK